MEKGKDKPVYRIFIGDCRSVMAASSENSIDSIVTDPPYDLTSVSRNVSVRYNDPTKPYGRHNLQPTGGFMGQAWDATGVAFSVDTWREAFRVLKPGGHLLAFGGTRTFHRMTCAIEDAGFEIRDCLSWLYGSGFPKSHDVSKAIDKMAGAERKSGVGLASDPVTPEAEKWAGWGTALKPGWEPIIVARKPLSAGTVAANVLQHGTGALNIDGCRIETSDNLNGGAYAKNGSERTDDWGAHNGFRRNQGLTYQQPEGRWPANVALDEDVAIEIGEVSRYFYCAKSSRRERNAGLEGMPERGRESAINAPLTRKQCSICGCTSCGGDHTGHAPGQMTCGHPKSAIIHVAYDPDSYHAKQPVLNHHPTVKPIALMRWLVRLVTPPGGVVLDPFMGSGSTGCAAVQEGFRFIGIDLSSEYCEIAEKRIQHNVLQLTR